jgi:hypothetical protein
MWYEPRQPSNLHNEGDMHEAADHSNTRAYPFGNQGCKVQMQNISQAVLSAFGAHPPRFGHYKRYMIVQFYGNLKSRWFEAINDNDISGMISRSRYKNVSVNYTGSEHGLGNLMDDRVSWSAMAQWRNCNGSTMNKIFLITEENSDTRISSIVCILYVRIHYSS